MYQKILVGFDNTEQGRDALALGRILAQANGAEMLIVTAPGEDGEDLDQLVRLHEADLVVLGSTHRGPIGRVLPGATVERLLGAEPCAVAVAPPGFGRPVDGDMGWRPLSGDAEDVGMRVIGVGFDGSRASREALGVATELAVPNGAALRVYTVARTYPHVPGADGDSRGPGVPTEAELLRQGLYEAVAELPAGARALPVFLRGFAADELVSAAKAGVDLMVLGSRTGGPLRRTLHKSVSRIVMSEATCPVLISPSNVTMPRAVLA
jgi:nucleotide-binding universal stress UspA family protein